MKSSFILYSDFLCVLDKLTDEQAGKLFKAIRAYHSGDNESFNELMSDPLINAVFSPFEMQFIKDSKKYDNVVERNKENIRKRWERINKSKEIPNDTKNTTGKNGIPNDTKNTDIDIDTDTDISSSKDSDIDINKKDISNDISKKKDIDLIYQAYPAKCPIRGSSTGKTAKNKEKIKTLLKSIPAEILIGKIKQYVEDCNTHKVYLKNFSTFLNNIPDVEEPLPDKKTELTDTDDSDRICEWEVPAIGDHRKQKYSIYLIEKKRYESSGIEVNFLGFVD